jgi:hypothetical protein
MGIRETYSGQLEIPAESNSGRFLNRNERFLNRDFWEFSDEFWLEFSCGREEEDGNFSHSF